MRAASVFSAVRAWRRWPGCWPLAALALCLAVTLALYGPALDLPYFWDDVPHFEFVLTHSLAQIWTDVRGMGYYRPIIWTLYKVLFTALPPGAATVPHAVLLLLHAANGGLLALVARRLLAPASGKASWGGLLAGLLFVTYPFAALPVCHWAAAMHPLVTTFLLGTVLAMLRYLDTSRQRWLALATGLAFLSSFVHESGVMAGPAALAVSLLWDGRPRRRPALRLAMPALASAFFLPIWLLVPKTQTTFEPRGWQHLLANATFFVQGPSFPLQPIARPLVERLALDGPDAVHAVAGLPWGMVAVVWGVALVALLAGAASLRAGGQGRLLGLTLAWSLLAALPCLVALPFSYVTVSQRLLYCLAAPSALLWAGVCLSLASRLPRAGLRLPLAAALALAIAAVPALYVRREVGLHELALQPLQELATVARRLPDERHLVVNPPNWVNYKAPWYALGQEGVSVSADYVDFGLLVRLNSGTVTQLQAATVTDVKAAPAGYFYSTIGEETPWGAEELARRAAARDRVWVTVYGEDGIEVQEAGRLRAGPASAPGRHLARFGDGLFLVAGSLDVEGTTATARLTWKVLDVPPEATVFCHVLNCQGRLLGQRDGFVLGRTLPFAVLAPGSEVEDVRSITLAQPPADGCWVLTAGLYLPDGARLPAYDGQGLPLPDDAWALTTP